MGGYWSKLDTIEKMFIGTGIVLLGLTASLTYVVFSNSNLTKPLLTIEYTTDPDI